MARQAALLFSRDAAQHCNSTAHAYRPLLDTHEENRSDFVRRFLSFARARSRSGAQSDDPSEVFLKAYMTSQQGEKLEHDNQLQAALAKFRFAGSLLEELRKTHADWQPAIVDFRSRKIGENILRVQGKTRARKRISPRLRRRLRRSLQPPVLPEKSGPAEPSVEVTPPRSSRHASAAPSEPNPAVGRDAMPRSRKRPKNCRTKWISLQAELKNRGTNTTPSPKRRRA